MAMIWGFESSTLLAGGYALLLGGIAAALERLGRGSHRFAERFHVAGFQYDGERDLWHCPEGQQLFRIAAEAESRLAIYRAPAHVCNCCHARKDCTDSQEGRRIECRLDSWIESELRRFHRGISLTLVGLAAVVLVWRIEGPDALRDRILLAVLLVLLAATEIRMLSSLLGGSRRAQGPGPQPE